MKRFVFAGMNPSKAGWPKGDLTVTKCCGFAMRAFGMLDLEVLGGNALFSPDGRYRYRLSRMLGRKGPTPSDDENLVRVDLVNVFGLVSTDPKGLLAARDPIGLKNAFHVQSAITDANMVIACWGSLPRKPVWLRSRAGELLQQLRQEGEVHALAVTADGSPAHPSRLPYSDSPKLYRGMA